MCHSVHVSKETAKLLANQLGHVLGEDEGGTDGEDLLDGEDFLDTEDVLKQLNGAEKIAKDVLQDGEKGQDGKDDDGQDGEKEQGERAEGGEGLEMPGDQVDGGRVTRSKSRGIKMAESWKKD